VESSFFCLIPVFIWCFAHFGGHFLGKAGHIMIWLFFMISAIILLLVMLFWIKFVPTKVSFALGAITWAMLIWAIGWHDYR
jgi:hypothetical protein